MGMQSNLNRLDMNNQRMRMNNLQQMQQYRLDNDINQMQRMGMRLENNMRMRIKRRPRASLMVTPDMDTRLTPRPHSKRALPEHTTPTTSELSQLYTQFLLSQLFSTEDTVCIPHPWLQAEYLWDTPPPPWDIPLCPSTMQQTQRPHKTLHKIMNKTHSSNIRDTCMKQVMDDVSRKTGLY